MTLRLSHSTNRNILLSIPSLFEDGKCRPFKLLAAELHGLWLESDALTERLRPDDFGEYASGSTAVFVPFAQIAAVLVITGAAQPAASNEKPESQRSTKHATARHDSTPSGSKRKR